MTDVAIFKTKRHQERQLLWIGIVSELNAQRPDETKKLVADNSSSSISVAYLYSFHIPTKWGFLFESLGAILCSSFAIITWQPPIQVNMEYIPLRDLAYWDQAHNCFSEMSDQWFRLWLCVARHQVIIWTHVDGIAKGTHRKNSHIVIKILFDKDMYW